MKPIHRSRAPLAAILAVTIASIPAAFAQSAPSPPAASARPPSPTEEAPAPEAREQASPRTQLFQVAMVLATSSANADLDGDGKSDVVAANKFEGLPRSVRKALEDLGDFLPYRGYGLMDTVLIRTSRRGISGMKGPGGREFSVELRFRPGGPGDETPIVVQGFEVVDMTATPSKSTGISDPSGTTQGSEMAPVRPKVIIATSFGMEIGETLVVGSSRLNGGDTALVMLVTAMP